MKYVLLLSIFISSFSYSAFNCPSKSYKIEGQDDFKSDYSLSFFKFFIEDAVDSSEFDDVGTATLVSRDGVFISAKHIITENNNALNRYENGKVLFFVRNYDYMSGGFGEKVYVKYVRNVVDASFDAAFFKVVDESNLKKLDGIDPVRLNFEGAANIDGYMYGFKNDVDTPHVELVNSKSYLKNGLRVVRGDGIGGFSGSLFLNKSGEGVAVLSSSYAGKIKTEENINKSLGFIDLSSIFNNIDRIESYSVDLLSSRQVISGASLVKLMRNDHLAAAKLLLLVMKGDIKLHRFDPLSGIHNLASCILNHKRLGEFYNYLGTTYFGQVGGNKYRRSIASSVVEAAIENYQEFKDSGDLESLKKASVMMNQHYQWESHFNLSDSSSYLANVNYDHYSILTDMAKNDISVEDSPLPEEVISKSVEYAVNSNNIDALAKLMADRGDIEGALLATTRRLQIISNNKDREKISAIKDWAFLANVYGREKVLTPDFKIEDAFNTRPVSLIKSSGVENQVTINGISEYDLQHQQVVELKLKDSSCSSFTNASVDLDACSLSGSLNALEKGEVNSVKGLVDMVDEDFVYTLSIDDKSLINRIK